MALASMRLALAARSVTAATMIVTNTHVRAASVAAPAAGNAYDRLVQFSHLPSDIQPVFPFEAYTEKRFDLEHQRFTERGFEALRLIEQEYSQYFFPYNQSLGPKEFKQRHIDDYIKPVLQNPDQKLTKDLEKFRELFWRNYDLSVLEPEHPKFPQVFDYFRKCIYRDPRIDGMNVLILPPIHSISRGADVACAYYDRIQALGLNEALRNLTVLTCDDANSELMNLANPVQVKRDASVEEVAAALFDRLESCRLANEAEQAEVTPVKGVSQFAVNNDSVLRLRMRQPTFGLSHAPMGNQEAFNLLEMYSDVLQQIARQSPNDIIIEGDTSPVGPTAYSNYFRSAMDDPTSRNTYLFMPHVKTACTDFGFAIGYFNMVLRAAGMTAPDAWSRAVNLGSQPATTLPRRSQLWTHPDKPSRSDVVSMFEKGIETLLAQTQGSTSRPSGSVANVAPNVISSETSTP